MGGCFESHPFVVLASVSGDGKHSRFAVHFLREGCGRGSKPGELWGVHNCGCQGGSRTTGWGMVFLGEEMRNQTTTGWVIRCFSNGTVPTLLFPKKIAYRIGVIVNHVWSFHQNQATSISAPLPGVCSDPMLGFSQHTLR